MIEIDKIKHFGWWYRCCENKYENNWWYSVFDEQIYNVEELFEKFSFESYDDIVNTNGYIPLWKTDEYEVTKSFLKSLKSKEADRYLEEKNGSDRFIEFEYYIESHRDYITTWWHEYSDNNITQDAIKWCRENGIPYRK